VKPTIVNYRQFFLSPYDLLVYTTEIVCAYTCICVYVYVYVCMGEGARERVHVYGACKY